MVYDYTKRKSLYSFPRIFLHPMACTTFELFFG